MRTTRRRLLTMGATGMLLPVMTGLVAEAAPAPRLPRVGAGRSVLLLGAGMAGLAAAYELTRAGFTVQVLEAQGRAGGRNLTARRGTAVNERNPDGSGELRFCQFDDGLYLNLGPGRLPHHHRRVMRYCRELGVALEPYIVESSANFVQSQDGFHGRPQTIRRVTNDIRGHLAEMLTRMAKSGAPEINADRTSLLDLLRVFGDLRPDGSYRGSIRSGPNAQLSVTQPYEAPAPLELNGLLESGYWKTHLYNPLNHLWQDTMFQPVGGMDKMVDGFLAKVGHLIAYHAPVNRIRLMPDGVEVSGVQNGRPYTLRAEHCLSSIPFPVLKTTVLENFDTSFTDAVAFTSPTPSCKVGWQANERFWENDTYQMYGGISAIDHMITQIWYPSYDYFTAKGTLTGAYNSRENAAKFGELGHAERLRTARQVATRLHPEFADDRIVPNDKGMSIAWHKVPYQLAGWAWWRDTAADRRAYGRLLAPDGRFHVIGDQVSPLPGWIEGALMSAEYVTRQVVGLERAEVPAPRRAPDSAAVDPAG
ncbi:flavin monoamine oxidase family protein [Lentzea albidocapillata]|nr:FAD-dependent oxidoreductase [Lentzea albidocapillata]